MESMGERTTIRGKIMTIRDAVFMARPRGPDSRCQGTRHPSPRTALDVGVCRLLCARFQEAWGDRPVWMEGRLSDRQDMRA